MDTIGKNCLPDGLETIQDKIYYVKSCYGIIGENANLFDWLLNEFKNNIVNQEAKHILNKNILFLEESRKRNSRGQRGLLSTIEMDIILEDFYIIKDILGI